MVAVITATNRTMRRPSPSPIEMPALSEPMPITNGLMVDPSRPANGVTVTTATATMRS